MATARRPDASPALSGWAVAGYAGRVQWGGGVAASVGVNAGVEPFEVVVAQWGSLGVPGYISRGDGVEEDGVSHVAVGIAREVLGVALDSGDGVAEVLWAEYFVHEQADVVFHVDADVDVDGAGGGHYLADGG